MTRRVAANGILQGLPILRFVDFIDLLDVGVGARRQDLDETGFVSSSALYGLSEFSCIELCRSHQRGQHQVLEVTGKFRFQVFQQVLSISGFVRCHQRNTLLVGSVTEEFDDGVLISPKPLHGFTKHLHILQRVSPRKVFD